MGAPEATEDVREKGISRDEKSKVGENLPPLCEGKPDGRGLQKVRDFILKIKPTEKDETFGLSWQELQLEPTPTLLPDLRYAVLSFCNWCYDVSLREKNVISQSTYFYCALSSTFYAQFILENRGHRHPMLL